jgi:hypothetical protein
VLEGVAPRAVWILFFLLFLLFRTVIGNNNIQWEHHHQ